MQTRGETTRRAHAPLSQLSSKGGHPAPPSCCIRWGADFFLPLTVQCQFCAVGSVRATSRLSNSMGQHAHAAALSIAPVAFPYPVRRIHPRSASHPHAVAPVHRCGPRRYTKLAGVLGRAHGQRNNMSAWSL